MNIHADKNPENQSRAVANSVSKKGSGRRSAFQFVNNRPEAIAQRKLQEMANNSPQVAQLRAFQEMANNSPQAKRIVQSQPLANNYPAHPQETIGREGNSLRETGKESGTSGGLDTSLPIQRYTMPDDKQYNVSENHEFAVPTEKYPGALYAQSEAPRDLAGGLKWNTQGALEDIDNVLYTKYVADISAYEKNGKVGSEQHCGAFARGITKNPEATKGDDRSISKPGGVLKDSNTSPGMEEGWENHFAAVVMVDEGDHATFETAVGISHTWVGIYGVNKGQTFRYKTQEANIDRLMGLADAVLPGMGPEKKAWWHYLCCLSGKPTDLVVHQGITPEQGAIYKDEMKEWRLHGTEPASKYMEAVVGRLKEELQQTGGE